jgi:excisionase family DNA binding protein
MDATRSPELLRVPEAAARLNVSRASVYRWIEEGRLPAVRLGGRGAPLRISEADLGEWLAESTVGSGSAVDSGSESAVGRGSSVDDPAERDGTSSSREAVEPAPLTGAETEGGT